MSSSFDGSQFVDSRHLTSPPHSFLISVHLVSWLTSYICLRFLYSSICFFNTTFPLPSGSSRQWHVLLWLRGLGFTGIDDPYERPLNCEVHSIVLSFVTCLKHFDKSPALSVVGFLQKLLTLQIVLQQKSDTCTSPCEMAETVVSYLEDHGYLQA